MTPRARFWKKEKAHWQELPLAPFTWMCILVLVSLCLSPLLPFVAYALQRWASAWNWRDRWASVRTLATLGIGFVCCLVVLALLDQMHFWLVPPIVSRMQNVWQTHLPGDLSLSPFDLHALAARLALLLPLAPGLALVYEYLDPRTRTQPRRILLQADLVPTPLPPAASVPPTGLASPPEAKPASAASAPPEQPAPPPTRKSVPPAKKPQPLHRKKLQPGAPASAANAVEQMTIDSFLTAADPAAPGSPKTTEAKAPKRPPDEPIDWDNVLE